MKEIHQGHGGIQGCLREARELLYWPRMSQEIKDFISNFSVGNTYKTKSWQVAREEVAENDDATQSNQQTLGGDWCGFVYIPR